VFCRLCSLFSGLADNQMQKTGAELAQISLVGIADEHLRLGGRAMGVHSGRRVQD
jgi:hypothetical protein